MSPSRYIWTLCLAILVVLGVASAALGQATVETDKEDYAPGETVFIMGNGWLSGEEVQLEIYRMRPESHGDTVKFVPVELDTTFYSFADEAGYFLNDEFVTQPEDTNTAFYVEAEGQTSGWTAETYFYDHWYHAGPRWISAGSQSPDPVRASQPATYSVTVESYWHCFIFTCHCAALTTYLEITSSLPSGVTYSFSPSSVYPGDPSCQASATLIIYTSPSTPAGDYALTVRGKAYRWFGWTYVYDTIVLSVLPYDVTPPVADVDPLSPVTGECSATVASAPTATDDVDGTVVGTTTDPLTYTAQGTYTVHWTYTDQAGNSSYQNQTVIVHDTVPPVMTCPGAITTMTDMDACQATVNFTPNVGDNCGIVSVAAAPAAGSLFDLGTTAVTCTATDIGGNTSSCTFAVTVYNPNPVVSINGPASGSLYAVGDPIDFAGTFTDANGGTHTATWTCGEASFAGTVDEGTGSVTGQHTIDTPGVYLLALDVDDQCGGAGRSKTVGGLEAMVVVYDPSAGFVTGGGWIESPPGAFTADPSLTGKANFGFVSKYKRGSTTPTGQTEFRFKTGDLDFHSTDYAWLVIAGAKAQFKGTGTINDGGYYGFMLVALDGEESGGNCEDAFRIKIVDKSVENAELVVYDNKAGESIASDAATDLGGGSIVIHTSGAPGNGGGSDDGGDPPALTPTVTRLFQNAPNPFNPTTQIRFALTEPVAVELVVFDVSGRRIRRLVDTSMPAGEHVATWDGRSDRGEPVSSGVYFYRLEAGTFTETRRMIMLK